MHSVFLQAMQLQISEASDEILQIKNHVCAGFPSPAEDLGAERIDLSKVLIKHPQATRMSSMEHDELQLWALSWLSSLDQEQTLKPIPAASSD